MADHHWEIERKYDVTPEQATGITVDRVQGFTVGEPVHHRMSATYYDTEDMALSALDVAVRRRTGGGDDGWHVKYQAGAARGEVHFEPLRTSERMPATLRKTLVGLTLGRPLGPVAVVDTQRHEYPVFALDGAQHAVVCVDVVSAHDQRAGVNRRWSECEIELSSGELSKKQTKAVFAAVEKVLFAAGAVPSSSPAKIARALGQTGTAVHDAVGQEPPAASEQDPSGKKGSKGKSTQGRSSGEKAARKPPSQHPEGAAASDAVRQGTGADVLADMCGYLVGQVQRWDFAVRVGADDAVHQMRVHSRALRSVLHAARAFVSEDLGSDLEERLKLLARALGDARDEEVAAEQLTSRLDAGLHGLIPDAARRELLEMASARSIQAARTVRRVMDSPAHLQLLTDLVSLSREGTIGGAAVTLTAKKFAKDVLGTALRDVVSTSVAQPAKDPRSGETQISELGREVSGRLATGEEQVALAVRFDHLHDARKAVKSVRYVSEALRRAGADPGDKRSRAAAQAKAYQDQLGALTDSAVMENWLARVGVSFHRTGRDRYAVGLLHGMELVTLRAQLSHAPKVMKDLVGELERTLPRQE